jgi:hypothetical protein
VKIGEIVFSLSSNRNIENILLWPPYSYFLCEDEPEIIIHANYNGLLRAPVLQDKNLFFDSGSIWKLYHSKDKIALVAGEKSNPFFYHIAVFDKDMKHVEIYSKELQQHNGQIPDPLQYPLAEVLMICLLAQGRGLMVHACGIDDDGRGYLFAGNSGHGKSTMAKLWRDQGVILNDDRIIIRQRGGRFWMYGTPWHGDYTGVSSQGVPLERIFFLNRGDVNSTRCLEGATAASKLLARCFPPLWHEEGMGFTLDFCAQVVSQVLCYELGFVPDNDIVDFVRCEK